MVTEWERHALPVLRALAESTDATVRDGYIGLGYGTGAQTLGLNLDDSAFHDALLALRDIGYVHVDNIEYAGGCSASVIGAPRRRSWPAGPRAVAMSRGRDDTGNACSCPRATTGVRAR